MNDWMKKLAVHNGRMRRRYPKDVLTIVFDIDGTIMDTRFLIQYVLREFDRIHGTRLFSGLKVPDITAHEDHVEEMLDQMPISPGEGQRILDFWLERRWLSSSLMESHRTFEGVMGIIRWFQLQPNVVVALNTGRPESLRADTLRSLNALGKEYNVSFKDELLHMNPRDWEVGVPQSKVTGIRRFQEAGYRAGQPFAAISKLDECNEILPMHPHGAFESGTGELPSCSVCGTEFDPSGLASGETLPEDIRFAWHGVNDPANLRQFLASDIRWGEVDIRTDPTTGELILHHDFLLNDTDLAVNEFLKLRDFIRRAHKFGKGIKFHFKEGGPTINRVLELVAAEAIGESWLWFNAEVEVLTEHEFRKLRKAFPSSIIQCSIDSFVDQILKQPEDARNTVERLKSWGISRFSVKWRPDVMAPVTARLSEWGFETNIYGVPDLDAFLHAVILEPRSVTSDLATRRSPANGLHATHFFRGEWEV